VIERQGDHVDHKVKLMVITSADDGAGRGYTMLLARVMLVADAIDELQRRCIDGYVLFRSLFRRLRLVFDGLLSRGLVDASAERTFVDVAEFVGLLHFAASNTTVWAYHIGLYWHTKDTRKMEADVPYVGLARGALESADDLVDAIVLHPLRVQFAQVMTYRAFVMFGWLDTSSSRVGDWLDSDLSVRDHREQLAGLVAKLQALSHNEIKQMMTTRVEGRRFGWGTCWRTMKITDELARLVFAALGQIAGVTDLEMEWANPKLRDPVAKYLLRYYESSFVSRMILELRGWIMYPRFSVVDQAALAPVQAESWSPLPCAILPHELSVNAPFSIGVPGFTKVRGSTRRSPSKLSRTS
jgi:hypothetical protein